VTLRETLERKQMDRISRDAERQRKCEVVEGETEESVPMDEPGRKETYIYVKVVHVLQRRHHMNASGLLHLTYPGRPAMGTPDLWRQQTLLWFQPVFIIY
jgi:hypothetical protein